MAKEELGFVPEVRDLPRPSLAALHPAMRTKTVRSSAPGDAASTGARSLRSKPAARRRPGRPPSCSAWQMSTPCGATPAPLRSGAWERTPAGGRTTSSPSGARRLVPRRARLIAAPARAGAVSRSRSAACPQPSDSSRGPRTGGWGRVAAPSLLGGGRRSRLPVAGAHWGVRRRPESLPVVHLCRPRGAPRAAAGRGVCGASVRQPRQVLGRRPAPPLAAPPARLSAALHCARAVREE